MNNSHDISEAKAGKALQQDVLEENSVTLLNDIMQQLEVIRTSVDQLTLGMNQVPEVMELTTDAINTLAEKARIKGIDIEERGEAALELIERLTQPQTMAKLNTMLDLSDQLPDFVTDAVNMVDYTIEEAHREGIDIAQRTHDILHLLKRISSPAMLKQINGMLDFAEQFTDMIGLGADSIDDTMLRLNKQGVDLYATAENLQKLMLAANVALQETLEESPEKIGGVFGLLRQLNNKDFQKVLAFLTTFGKYFGRQLGK